MRKLLLASALLASGFPLHAAESCVTLDNKEVASLFDDWNFALSSLDPNQVTQRYWPNAVLLPTLSNTPRTSAAMINEYFEHFLAKRPRGRIDTRTIQSGCNMAVDMGTYTFSLMDDKGAVSEVAARYTFVYQYRDGAWKILDHHSSLMPEASPGAAPEARMAKDEAAETPAPAKRAKKKPEPAEPLSRRERRAMLGNAPKSELTAAKPADKTAEKPAAPAPAAVDAKPTLANTTPPAAQAKNAAAVQPSTDIKSAPEVRTAMFANLTSSPAPFKFYPPEAARRKERGTVNLKVCADGTGAVSEAMEVLRSSGSKLLDEAAISWAREVTWVPATYNRRRVEGCAKVDVSFEPPPELAQARRP